MKRTVFGLSMVVLVLAATAPALAQPRGSESTDNGFQFRLGGFFPAGGGELWRNNEDYFALDHSDFNDGVLGLSYVTGISNHLEMGFNVDFYESTVGAFDHEVGLENPPGLHPRHDTRLRMTPVTVDFRFLPAGRYQFRGRSGQYRVHRPVPYLGAGVGLNFWGYEERGDFLYQDINTGEYVADYWEYKDDGTAFEAHVLGGLELPMGSSWSLLFEGRYSWIVGNKARVSDSYVAETALAPQDLKLDGAYAFVGASWRF